MVCSFTKLKKCLISLLNNFIVFHGFNEAIKNLVPNISLLKQRGKKMDTISKSFQGNFLYDKNLSIS